MSSWLPTIFGGATAPETTPQGDQTQQTSTTAVVTVENSKDATEPVKVETQNVVANVELVFKNELEKLSSQLAAVIDANEQLKIRTSKLEQQVAALELSENTLKNRTVTLEARLFKAEKELEIRKFDPFAT